MSSALSGSARSLSIRQFIEDNEKLLISLENDDSIMSDSDSQYYSEYEEDYEDECYPTLQQSIIRYSERNDIPELKKSILQADTKQDSSLEISKSKDGQEEKLFLMSEDSSQTTDPSRSSSSQSRRDLSAKDITLSEAKYSLVESDKLSQKSRSSRHSTQSKGVSSMSLPQSSVSSAKSKRSCDSSVASSRKQPVITAHESDLKTDDLESFSHKSEVDSKSQSSRKSRNQSSLVDSYQTYLETQKLAIAKKWAREDARKQAKEAELESEDKIFMAHKKPYVFTGIKRQHIEVYEGYKEEDYTHVRIQPNLPKQMSQKLKDQLEIPVMERLMAPKAKHSQKPPTTRVDPAVIDAFISRQMQYENSQRIRHLQRRKRGQTNPNSAIFNKLYQSSLVDQWTDIPPEPSSRSTAKWTNDEKWWKPKLQTPQELVDTSKFRDLRFNAKSMKMTKGKPSLFDRTQDLSDVLEAERVSQLEQQRMMEFRSQYE